MTEPLIQAFSPHQSLAAALLPHAVASVTEGIVEAETGGTPGAVPDGAHDGAHLLRVFRNAMRIHAAEGGDARVIAAAVMLHDCVSVEKNAPLRSQASRLAAQKARPILAQQGWEAIDIDAVAHAIEAHSYSANVTPSTLEARILQDADRLDAIGMIGAARCFYIAGRMGSALYDPLDPRAARRELDDKAFAIDHFETKLLRLAGGFNTETGRALAVARQARLRSVLDLLLDEIEG